MEAALEICDQMSKRGLVLDEISYTTLVNGLCSSGCSREASLIAENLIKQGLAPSLMKSFSAILEFSKLQQPSSGTDN